MNKNNDLTKTQNEILERRKRINRRSLEEEKVEPFTKYKIITYLFIFLFTPYGLYRLLCKNSPFKKGEKIVYTIIGIVYIISIYDTIIKMF